MEEILKQFDEKFVGKGFNAGITKYENRDGTDITPSKIKDFITTVIAERDKKMESEINKLRRVLAHHPECIHKDYSSECDCSVLDYHQGYNTALSDAISIIKEFNK